MSSKLAARTHRALWLAAGTAIAIGLSVAQAGAAEKPKYDSGSRTNYGPGGPNVSYQQGPHTRIYVTKRSWLDAGVEVLPGDRKFNDYAFPQERPFSSSIGNRSLDRQPLSPPSDLGGYPPVSFPLY